MSSENLHHTDNQEFSWNNSCNSDDYIYASYIIITPVDGELAAYGIAREQSICTTSLDAIEMPENIESFCAKVVEVEKLEGPLDGLAALYYLNTTVYGNKLPNKDQYRYRIVIAYPLSLFNENLTQIWNSIFGEVHRLGYLSSAVLSHIQLPQSLKNKFPGANYGMAGIREKLGLRDRPIFCRSMRPAVGLETSAMVKLNRLILSGGFDVIKDDELTYDNPRSPFVERITAMLRMKSKVEDQSGEKKLYFANIIDDYPSALRMADQAAEAGVDGLMVSASAQGFSMISEISRRTGLLVLAHNSCGDALTRASSWGASDAVMATMQRAAGADLVVSPGPFASPYQDPQLAKEFLDACATTNGPGKPIVPIIQGGKQPEFLGDYIRAVGSTDFMIIVATWVDHHPEGMQVGAQAFRQAWVDLNKSPA